MKRLIDTNSCRWIREATGVREEHGPKCVRDLLPAIFDSYLKVLHPIFEDPTLPESDHANQIAEQIKRTFSDLRAILTAKPDEQRRSGPGQRVRWRALANRFGVKISPEISVRSFELALRGAGWPRNLIGPEEGNIELGSLRRLVHILTRHTDDGAACFFLYDRIAARTLDSDLLFCGRLEEVLATAKLKEAYGSPTYWWPEDHSWCVSSDWDLSFSLIGGNKDLSGAIALDDFLETVSVTPDTLLIHESDSS